YQASCHCGTIRYTVTLSPPLSDPECWVGECNCSICSRNGYLNVYVRNECVEFELGPSALESGNVVIQHYFCGRCGSSLMCESIEAGFYEGIKAINVRMFQGIDLKSLQRKEEDGRAL
ncbi:hypothetical protein GQ43DRAFT_380778, partial [Delitschia confertaspora ATCC 74209]